MAKLKTHKSIAKRFKVTGKGNLKFKKPGVRHLNAKKSVAQRRRKNSSKILDNVTRKYIVKSLPGLSSITK